jgi:uncharacterized protein
MTGLPIIGLFVALFGFMLIVMTVEVGLRRGKVCVLLLNGGNEMLLRRIGSHANFLEYVPLALILVALLGANGASATFLYSTGTVLLVARALHYFTLTFFDSSRIRPISMLGTTGVIIALAIGLLAYYWRNTHGL